MRFDINLLRRDIMIEPKNQVDNIDKYHNYYYQLFRKGELICEELNCSKTATEKLTIPLGVYGSQVFFFCEDCINKFINLNTKSHDDNSLSEGNYSENIEQTKLVLDIQNRIYGPETFRRKFMEHIKNGGDPDVF